LADEGLSSESFYIMKLFIVINDIVLVLI